ncbi:hypothetical protein [Streptomyces sp. MZ04]|uniref:hypothetical protein n=1 Tax=Streptomyces sp. MZ04 TaxID=2559236 RepID=UPI00107EE42C|nr:hypothetical protein [Streptomyces sp. MZ04]TGB06531.1 hypothetical protein E2651_23240 [Streptomyces sp. MZ04]
MYRLLCDATLMAVWDSLPDDASEQLTLGLADVCHDPEAATEPWGFDDGIHRQLIRPLVTALIAVNHERRTVRIYDIQRRRR